MSQHDADLEDYVRKVREALKMEPFGTWRCKCPRVADDELAIACPACSDFSAGVDAFAALMDRLGLDAPELTDEEADEEMAALLRRAERDVGERN